MLPQTSTLVLIVTDGCEATEATLAAIRGRAAAGPVRVRVLVPNPARTEVHVLHPERHDAALDAELALLEALPAYEAAAGGRVIGTVSIRHDPCEAVQELLLAEEMDEILVAMTSGTAGHWPHADLAHRLARFGLPVTVVPSGPGG